METSRRGASDFAARVMYMRTGQAQVVVDGHDAGEHADDGEHGCRPTRTAALKSANFAMKPAVPGMPASESMKSVMQRGEARALAREAGEVVEASQSWPASRERHQHGERAEVHEDVGEQVEEHGAVAFGRAGDEADQQVAGVRDARVGEQALHVVLDHRHHVADDDRRAASTQSTLA